MITSEQINYLIYRYLLESGYTHSTFAFMQESAIHTRDYHQQYTLGNGQGLNHQQRPDEILASRVPPGALINFLQKGLQYVEAETHTNEDGTEKICSAPFSLVCTHECDTPHEKSSNRDEKALPSKKAKREDGVTSTVGKRDRKDGKRGQNTDREKRARKESGSADLMNDVVESHPNGDGVRDDKSVDIDAGVAVTSESISILAGHESEVFLCAWNPVHLLVASGSADGTARIWKVPNSPQESVQPAIVLMHSAIDGSKDVTTLEWNRAGTLLASGSYEGHARIWTNTGDLKHHMKKHGGPIFSVKWNPKGDLLVTASMDMTTIIWDTTTGESRQQFSFHVQPAIDVDWKDDITFASCSSDKQIYVCRLGSLEPLQQYVGHTHEVNCLKWDPSGKYLASCSDDCSAKVWTLESASPLWDFAGHQKGIYAVRWSPQSQAVNRRLLATGAWDNTVRLWDTANGSCVFVLNEHSAPVYSVSFSPDGAFLASGAFDNLVNIWRVSDGKLVRSYRGRAGFFEVGWSGNGTKISACSADGTISLIHLKSLL